MTITIPVWLLWTLAAVIGVPLLVGVLAFAWMGYQFSKINWR
jgi:hypothetical protein